MDHPMSPPLLPGDIEVVRHKVCAWGGDMGHQWIILCPIILCPHILAEVPVQKFQCIAIGFVFGVHYFITHTYTTTTCSQENRKADVE